MRDPFRRRCSRNQRLRGDQRAVGRSRAGAAVPSIRFEVMLTDVVLPGLHGPDWRAASSRRGRARACCSCPATPAMPCSTCRSRMELDFIRKPFLARARVTAAAMLARSQLLGAQAPHAAHVSGADVEAAGGWALARRTTMPAICRRPRPFRPRPSPRQVASTPPAGGSSCSPASAARSSSTTSSSSASSPGTSPRRSFPTAIADRLADGLVCGVCRRLSGAADRRHRPQPLRRSLRPSRACSSGRCSSCRARRSAWAWCRPTRTWGVAASALMVTLRLIQGFCLGGELPGALTYVVETAPRIAPFVCGVVFACVTMGVAVATGVSLGVRTFLSRRWCRLTAGASRSCSAASAACSVSCCGDRSRSRRSSRG